MFDVDVDVCEDGSISYPSLSRGACPWAQAEGRLGCMVGVGLLLSTGLLLFSTFSLSMTTVEYECSPETNAHPHVLETKPNPTKPNHQTTPHHATPNQTKPQPPTTTYTVSEELTLHKRPKTIRPQHTTSNEAQTLEACIMMGTTRDTNHCKTLNHLSRPLIPRLCVCVRTARTRV